MIILFHSKLYKMLVSFKIFRRLSNIPMQSKSYFNCCLHFHFHYSFISKGWNIQKMIAFYLYNLRHSLKLFCKTIFSFWPSGWSSDIQNIHVHCKMLSSFFLKMWHRRPLFILPNGKWRCGVPPFLETESNRKVDQLCFSLKNPF